MPGLTCIASKDTHRFAAWSAAWYELSTQAEYADAWLDGMEAGLVNTRALGNYANGHDPYGPNGQATEHPGWRSGDFALSDPPEPANASPALTGVLDARKSSESGDFLYETGDTGMIITGYTGPGGNVAIPETIQGRAVTELGTRAFERRNRDGRFFRLRELDDSGDPRQCGPLRERGLSWLRRPDPFDDPRGCDHPGRALSLGLLQPRERDDPPGRHQHRGQRLPFYGCASLANIAIPEAVTNLGTLAFSDCPGLTNITVPGSVTRLGGAPFFGCANLTGGYFEGPAPTPGMPNVFQGTRQLTVYYRAGSAGWSPAYAGCPTALWATDPYTQWGKTTGLLDQYPAACG